MKIVHLIQKRQRIFYMSQILNQHNRNYRHQLFHIMETRIVIMDRVLEFLNNKICKKQAKHYKV